MHSYRFRSGRLLSTAWSALLLLLLGQGILEGATWSVSDRIPVSNHVVRIIADARRPWIYAIDKTNNDVLFINLETRSVEKRLYVGKDPTDADLDATGNLLFVAN